LIPPTPVNLKIYERWTDSDSQDTVFFTDLIEGPTYILPLEQGNTLLIPPGWIHAVYTPVDTLVVGGNYLHPFGIDVQVAVFQIENRTRVPFHSRFPFFIQLHWYYLQNYVDTESAKFKQIPKPALREWERKSLISLIDLLYLYIYLSPVENSDYYLEVVSRILKDEPLLSLEEFKTSKEDRKLYCLCQQPDSLIREDWIGCDHCSEWYHCECVGLTIEERESMDEFICPLCVKKGVKSKKKKLKNSTPQRIGKIPKLQNSKDISSAKQQLQTTKTESE